MRKFLLHNPIIKCSCGCETDLFLYDKYGRKRKGLPGHWKRNKALTPFIKRIQKTNDCWLWLGAKSSLGYGYLSFMGKKYLAHRFLYECIYGQIPPDKHLLHSCDNPSCVNPHHMTVGTPLSNCHDKLNKHRAVGVPLSDEDVLRIRILYKNSGLSMSKIAQLYGSNPCHIQRIIHRERRSNVSDL